MHTAASPPGRLETAAYAAGSFGTGVFSTVPTILLLYFCTEVLRVPPAWAAAIVFAPKAWSIVWDPFVGAWSDNTSTRLGRRRPFLIAGTVGVVVSFVAVFTPPSLDLVGTGAWVACAYFALATLYSLFAVPYTAIPAEIDAPVEARARLVAARMFVAMIGVLTGAGVVPLLVEAGGGGRVGYAHMSVWVAAACAVAMTGPVLMLRGRDTAIAAGTRGPRPKITGNLWTALSHHGFVRLVCAYLLQLTAAGVIGSAAPYLVTRAFGRGEGDIGTAMLTMLVATTVAIPAWAWAGRRFGNLPMLVLAIVAYGAVASAIGLLAGSGAPWAAALVAFAMIGVPFAAMQVLPYTIVAHLVHEHTRGGAAAEGSFTGVWTATEKLGLALGPGLTGIVLSLAQANVTGSLAAFTATGPAVLLALSLPLMFAYRRAMAASRELPA